MSTSSTASILAAVAAATAAQAGVSRGGADGATQTLSHPTVSVGREAPVGSAAGGPAGVRGFPAFAGILHDIQVPRGHVGYFRLESRPS